MRKVYKYSFDIADEFVIEMPIKAKVLCWNFQRGIPCIWALVDPEETEMKTMHFRLAGTGHPIDNDDDIEPFYIGTVFIDDANMVLHLFLTGMTYELSITSKPHTQ
jgi:hypothetical protein